jgi:hypothetical protein
MRWEELDRYTERVGKNDGKCIKRKFLPQKKFFFHHKRELMNFNPSYKIERVSLSPAPRRVYHFFSYQGSSCSIFEDSKEEMFVLRFVQLQN